MEENKLHKPMIDNLCSPSTLEKGIISVARPEIAPAADISGLVNGRSKPQHELVYMWR